ncbi:MAG TPA: DUF1080 domain-containing protein [Opitutaceae bacterium]|nr:DUF1080 domain-containing protein [Opitutaceae bacterium]
MIPRIPGLFSALLSMTASALFAADAPTPTTTTPPPAAQPRPELTEQWEPVPPVVTAAPNSAPSDAIILFADTNAGTWEPVNEKSALWKVEDGAMVVTKTPGANADQKTKQAFGDIQLHLEFRTPAKVVGKSQDRGNSGIFFMGIYELQVLDSFDNPTYVNGQAGSIYKQHPPLVNASRGPGEWQVYDAVFVAPRFDEAGHLLSPARVTAFHNGVLVQHDVVLKGPTSYRGTPPYKAHAAKLPLVLQDHNNPIAFRNIWVRELNLPETK